MPEPVQPPLLWANPLLQSRRVDLDATCSYRGDLWTIPWRPRAVSYVPTCPAKAQVWTKKYSRTFSVSYSYRPRFPSVMRIIRDHCPCRGKLLYFKDPCSNGHVGRTMRSRYLGSIDRDRYVIRGQWKIGTQLLAQWLDMGVIGQCYSWAVIGVLLFFVCLCPSTSAYYYYLLPESVPAGSNYLYRCQYFLSR